MELMAFMETMGSSNVPVIAAFFIGLMTAISPCPLTTNITAIAFISRRIGDGRQTVLLGIIYTIGRMFSYAALASLIVYMGLNTQQISSFLQSYGGKMIGPVLVFTGLVMLEAIKFDFMVGGDRMDRLGKTLADLGYAGAFLLGVLFALAFCPFSAVLYFGMMIPLALKAHDGVAIPSAFALATGLPVIVSSAILSRSLAKLGQYMGKIRQIEQWTRKTAAIVVILAGTYYLVLSFQA
ncbi:MAG: aromatic aminobenezylarsenical efflux permease ArsG family transporter [Candidatus Altiarchaeota archaeon]